MAASSKSTPSLEEEEDEDKSDRKPRPPKGKKISEITYPDITTFDDLLVSDNLLRGIKSLGFEKPTRIQQKVILPIMDGRHAIVEARTGTGKTAAFVIGVLHRIDFDSSSSTTPSLPSPQALILCPGRELALKIRAGVSSFGIYLPLRSLLLAGGFPLSEQIGCAKENPHIVVGTPGRVTELLKRKIFDFSNTKVIVLDEADRLLSYGFKEEIDHILSLVWNFSATTTKRSLISYPSHQPQLVVCSETFPCEVSEVTEKFAINPFHLHEKEKTLLKNQHFYVAVEKEECKLDTLCDLLDQNLTQVMVFCNTRRKAEFVSEQLINRHFPVSCTTGHPDESGASRVLVTTDLLARGIEISFTRVVLNYDMPSNQEGYIFRMGRLFGKTGTVINFVMAKEAQLLREIENAYITKIDELPMNFSNLD